MASNSISSHRVDKAVEGYLLDAGQDEGVLVADKVPEITVGSKNFSGILYSMPLAAYLGDGSATATNKLKRAVDSPFPELFTDYVPTKTTYECEARGGKPRLLTDLEAARWDFSVELKAEKAYLLRRAILTGFEYDTMVGQVFAAGNWTNAAIGALTGGAGVAWSTKATSKPTQDGNAVRELIRSASGVYPDFGFITHNVLNALRTHPETLGALTIGAAPATMISIGNTILPDQAVLDLWAQRWGLSGGLFATDAQYNSANPGQAAVRAELAAGQLWMGCKRGVRGAMTGTGGVALLGSGPVSLLRVREYGLQGYSWRSEDPPGDWIAAEHSYTYVRPTDMAGTAYLVTGVV